MQVNKSFLVLVVLGAAVIGAGTAFALLNNREQTVEKAAIEKPVIKSKTQARKASDTPWREQRTAAAQAPQVQPRPQPRCETSNIAGTVVGGVAGGLIGNQFGSGSGRTLATVAGAGAGAYAGSQYIPLHQTSCE